MLAMPFDESIEFIDYSDIDYPTPKTVAQATFICLYQTAKFAISINKVGNIKIKYD
jgi:hypothetical protein